VEHGAHFLILYYPVPNLSITIRNCFIAVRRRGCCANDPGTSNRAPRVSARRPLDTLERVEVSTNANLRALCVLDTGKGKGAWATLRLSLPVRVRARASPRLSHCVPLTAPLSLCPPHRVSLTVSPSPRLSHRVPPPSYHFTCGNSTPMFGPASSANAASSCGCPPLAAAHRCTHGEVQPPTMYKQPHHV
jgi:hypothetical protein